MAGKPDPKAQEFLGKISSQKVFLFSTHGASASSQHARNAMEEARKMTPDGGVIGFFNCPGEVNPVVLKRVSSKPEPPVWLADAPAAKGIRMIACVRTEGGSKRCRVATVLSEWVAEVNR